MDYSKGYVIENSAKTAIISVSSKDTSAPHWTYFKIRFLVPIAGKDVL